MAEEAEEDDCRPDVVELARTTVAALLSRVTATEPTPDDTDAREDGQALGASSPSSPAPTTVLVSSPTPAVLKSSSSSSNPTPTSSSLRSPPKFAGAVSPPSKLSSPSSELRSDASNVQIISTRKHFARRTAGGQRGSPVGFFLLCSSLNFLLKLSMDRFRLGYCVKWTSATLSHVVKEIGRYSSTRLRKLSTSSVE